VGIESRFSLLVYRLNIILITGIRSYPYQCHLFLIKYTFFKIGGYVEFMKSMSSFKSYAFVTFTIQKNKLAIIGSISENLLQFSMKKLSSSTCLCGRHQPHPPSFVFLTRRHLKLCLAIFKTLYTVIYL
jgi:hypothetical protein